MKKRLFALVILCALILVSLCACNGGVNYRKLNKLVQDSYAEIKLTVNVSLDGETLTSTFEVKNEAGKSTVDYRIEQLETIVEPIIPSEQRKRVTIGGVIVENGKVTQKNGEAVEGINFQNISSTGISFKKSYFQNAKMTDDEFSADVVRPGMFIGSSVACNNMKVTVVFGETPTMEITYLSSNGAQVKLSYEFFK